MAIVGGAIIPLVFGFILDFIIPAGRTAIAADYQKAYRLFIPCYLFILYYAVAGHKIGLKNR